MGDSYVQVGADGVGKKLQSKDNVIGANTVHSEGVFLTDDTGASVNPNKEATQVLAEAHLGTIDTSTATIAGDTTSIDGKITACDTTALATQATLATIDADTGALVTDLALVHTHVAGVETQDTEINAHVHALDAELVLVHAHIGTIDTAIGEINAHIHSLDAKDANSTAYKFAYVNIQADGDLIALVAGKKIRVHGLVVHAIDTSTGMIKTDDAGGAVKLEFNLSAREGMVLPFSPAGWFETVAGEALYADFVVGAETMFVITYSEV